MEKAKQYLEWMAQERHRQKAKEIGTDFHSQLEKIFLEHPKEAGETYREHLAFTMKMGCRLAYSAGAVFLHGIIPCLCTTTASRQVKTIYGIMKNRTPKNHVNDNFYGSDI